MRLALLALVPAMALVGAASDSTPVLDPAAPYRGVRSSPVTYQVDLSAIVTPPAGTKLLEVWMPIPPSDEAQQVSGRELSAFPTKIEPRLDTEKLFGNRFAYFRFAAPLGAQVIRHRFTVKTWQIDWDLDPAKVREVPRWPDSFRPYLRAEPLLPQDDTFRTLAAGIVKQRGNAAGDLLAVMDWINARMRYSHEKASLVGDARHALENRTGNCSDYHGLCNALGRSLGYPTRIVYGINPYPKNSPSHCKLEAYLPPHGWVTFDLSETQNFLGRIRDNPSLSAGEKERLSRAAQARLRRGYRDNTWFLQTRGSDYDLAPPARQKVTVVRTIHAEADGVPLPEPDPANPRQRTFGWMTAHAYQADRSVPQPYHDPAVLK